jgi:hypothetical protein
MITSIIVATIIALHIPATTGTNSTDIASTSAPNVPTTNPTSTATTASTTVLSSIAGPSAPYGFILKFDGGIDRMITLDWKSDPEALYWNVERNCSSVFNPFAIIKVLDPHLVDYQVSPQIKACTPIVFCIIKLNQPNFWIGSAFPENFVNTGSRRAPSTPAAPSLPTGQ